MGKKWAGASKFGVCNSSCVHKRQGITSTVKIVSGFCVLGLLHAHEKCNGVGAQSQC